jgi:hypothetical protein
MISREERREVEVDGGERDIDENDRPANGLTGGGRRDERA